MPTFVPPPEQRFDPITARWLTPGGPLYDYPARPLIGFNEELADELRGLLIDHLTT